MSEARDKPRAPASMPPVRGKLAWTSVLLSIALVCVTLALVDARQVLQQLEDVDSRWVLVAFCVHVLQLAVLGLRYSKIAGKMGHSIPWLRASMEYALSVFLNQVVPTGVVGDGIRAIRQAKLEPKQGVFRWLEVVALDRVSGQLALWVVVLGTAPFSQSSRFINFKTFSVVSLGVVSSLALIWWSLNSTPELRRRLAPARRVLREAFSVLLSPRAAIGHLSLSFLFTGLTLAQLYIAALAVGVQLSMAQLAWVGPLIILAMSTPSFFGGWGIREGASALLFAALGMAGSVGVAVSLAYGVFALVIALPGVVVLLLDPARVSRPLIGWSNAHALSVLSAWAIAVWINTPALLAGVAVLSLLILIVQSRSHWTVTGRFGPANLVTTLRLVMVVFLLTCFGELERWTLAWLSGLVLCLDGVDGFLARKLKLASEFGSRFDIEVDALFVVTVTVMLWGLGLAGPWVMVAGAWRYLYVLAPLLVMPKGEEVKRPLWGRYAFVLMLACFFGALVSPVEIASLLSAVGVVVISASFALSFWLRYRPQPA